MKKRSLSSLLLSLFLIAVIILTACTGPAVSDTTTKAPAKTEAPASTTEATKEPVKVTMFFSNTNTVLPEDYNASENKYIQ